jgi:ribonuclease E
MLDNEPNNQNEEPNNQNEAADQPAPAKKVTRKRTAKKAAAQVDSAEAAVGTQSDAASSDPAANPEAADAVQAPAKKTATKRTAKKAVAKRTAKKAAAQPETDGGRDTLPEPTDAEAPAPDPVKKTTRKRTTKKAAAPAPEPDLLTTDSVTTDGPVASTDAPAATKPETRTRRRGAAAAAVLFQAPVEVTAQAAATSPVEATPEPAAEPERPVGRRTRRRSAEPETTATEPQAPTEQTANEQADEQTTESAPRRSRRSRGRHPEEVAADRADSVLEEVQQTDAAEEVGRGTDEDARTTADEADGEDGEGTRRRRRRRGGRRRRKGGDNDDSTDNADDGADDRADTDETDDQSTDSEVESEHDQSGETDESDESDEEGEGAGTSSRRRRRRRRRKGEDNATAPDDPDEIVVRVREPRSKNTANEITAVEGSTRLEAKKQRRREGRAAGRRRAPIVTEAEFLARRESVERTMVIRARGDLTQIAVSEDNVLVEHYVAQEEQSSLIGNVYLGRVQNVLPSMEAAFIDIGKGRNAVLYAGEVDWSTLGASNGPRKIESVLKSGQSVLVQVTKDPIGHKGARLTNQISLPGRYVVYVPRGGNGGISRKLPDTERNRLKGILKDIVPDEAGVIVRTAAEGASEDELTRDVSRLQSYWEDIEKKSKSGQAPQLLYGEPDLLIRVVRDLFTEDFTKLVIAGDEAFNQVKEYVSYVAPHLADRVEKWTGDGDVFANFRIDEQIKKALDRKVWLPSGGSLIIDRTEAMTVVDVNTGKFTGSGGNLEETVTRNNLEAAEEIVRQLRLRDIGGIIVIDFIDMVLELNRDLVLRRLVECLGRDRTKHQVAEVTSLGLVQMTRKRIGTGLLEAFGENCDHCGGRGVLLHDEPKESKRRSDGEVTNAEGDGGKAIKSSRSGRSRGKGRGRGEVAEEQEEAPKDAAKRLAEIAAASKVVAVGESGRSEGDPTPTETDGALPASDEAPQTESQQAVSQQSESHANESHVDESHANEPHVNEPHVDEPRADEPHEDQARHEEPREDESRQEEARESRSRRSGSSGRRRRSTRTSAGARDAGRDDESDSHAEAADLTVAPV